ncbi:DUF3750 domain-containing protein [Maridesulfovibrio sp. FT414]|uniref:DUF3750 domain-containing protein n=1 Tax=Maridesulfovibrio sp. FT414 TaxID=2979469 RepID=UPI003D802C31
MKNISKILFSIMLLLALNGCSSGDWRTASREPAGIAPDPASTREAVVQVYAAPAWGWRGWFAVHTWIAAKKTGADGYTVYEVIGWRQSRGLPIVRIERDAPDRYWFGRQPELVADFRGQGGDELIARIDAAARSYPWGDTYKAFPGPNSNTFTAWVLEQVPEFKVELPFSAIGSGFRG